MYLPVGNTSYKLRYRAPELLVGDAGYGRGVDVWAIGCLLAELATGQPLFPGESDLRTLQLVLATVGGRLTERQRSVLVGNPLFASLGDAVNGCCLSNGTNRLALEFGDEISELLKKCLEIDPEQRPTCEELLADKYFAADAENLETEIKELVQKEALESQMRMKESLAHFANEASLRIIAEDKDETTNNNSDGEDTQVRETGELKAAKHTGGKINKVTITFPKGQRIEHAGSSTELNTSFTKKSTKVPSGGGAALGTIFFKESKNGLKAMNSKRNFRDTDFQNPPSFLKDDYSAKGNSKYGLLKLKGKNVIPSQVTSYPTVNRLVALPQIPENKVQGYMAKMQFAKRRREDSGLNYDYNAGALNDSTDENVNPTLFKTSANNIMKERTSMLPSILPRHVNKAVSFVECCRRRCRICSRM
eukprot:TRINITY_DN2902_c0_g4_i1.p1 TRINITY_DN2902_c0_g4~~TRINITY_DN2902_c0_g4_i1.p1  ORF type:complete len:420 (-),score=92.19 TRINITY_DN2902_c0_g4_i1:333-1592(-)